MKTKKIAGIIAAAAAIAFVTAPITSTLASAHTKKVPCYGVNSCKGQSKCKSANGCKGMNNCKGKNSCKGMNNCKGKNSCKGQGVVMKTPASCKKAGGTLEKPNS